MKITDEFAAIMSYLTLLNEMQDSGIDIDDFPLNNLEIDFINSIVNEIMLSMHEEDQKAFFLDYIKNNIVTLFSTVFEQYANEIEEHNLPLNGLLN